MPRRRDNKGRFVDEGKKSRTNEYCRNYYREHIEQEKEKYRRYRLRNREKINRRKREYWKNNNKYSEYQREWIKNHPEIVKERYKKYGYYYRIQRTPEKIKARDYARHYNFRNKYCLLCLLENKNILSKHFHHTNYEANLGFSVCLEHHHIADKWLKVNYLAEA